jgi:hypothetical protein
MLVDEDEALLGELQPKVRFEILNSAPRGLAKDPGSECAPVGFRTHRHER